MNSKKMLKHIKKIVNYLEHEYYAYCETCGALDEINTLPCRDAYRSARKIRKSLRQDRKSTYLESDSELFNNIKKAIPPSDLKIQSLDDVLRNVADDNEAVENLLVEYGIKHFVKKWDKNYKTWTRYDDES